MPNPYPSKPTSLSPPTASPVMSSSSSRKSLNCRTWGGCRLASVGVKVGVLVCVGWLR
jgi:hypothetical protein